MSSNSLLCHNHQRMQKEEEKKVHKELIQNLMEWEKEDTTTKKPKSKKSKKSKKKRKHKMKTKSIALQISTRRLQSAMA